MEDSEMTKEQEKKVRDKFESFFKDNCTQEDLDKVIKKEGRIKGKSKKGPLKKFADDVGTLISMIKSYISGEYRQIPLASLTATALTLLYIFSPVDIIPDFIPALGLTDDAGMVGLCLKFISLDLNKYRQWLENREDGAGGKNH